MKRLQYVCILSILALLSCKKGEFVESTEYTKIASGDPNYTFIRYANLTPGSPTVNFFLNGTKSSGVYTTTGKEAGMGYITMFPSGGAFIPVSPGENTVSAKVISSATADANVEVFKSTITTAGGKYYTLFTNGVYNTTDKKIPSSILLEETKPALDTTKVFIRFINLYNGGPNIDLVQQSTGQKLVSNIAYGTASDFVAIPNPGQSNIYQFFNSSTSTVISSTGTLTATLIKGQAYTIIARGVSGSTTYPFGINYYATFY